MKKLVALAAIGTFLFGGPLLAANAPLRLSGSLTLMRLVRATIEPYSKAYGEATTIQAWAGGSRLGLEQLATGSTDIADTDWPVSGHPEFVDHKVFAVPFAVVVQSGLGVRSLSSKDVRAIFSGTITNWRELGGVDRPVRLIGRPPSSAARLALLRTFMAGAPLTASETTVDDDEDVVAAARTTGGGVTYVSLGALRGEGVEAPALDGILPSAAHVADGTYPFWSYEHMYTKGFPSAEASRLIALVQSNKPLLERFGYVAIRDIQIARSDR